MNPQTAYLTIDDIQGGVRFLERQHVKRAALIRDFQHKGIAIGSAGKLNLPAPLRIGIAADIDEGFLNGNLRTELLFGRKIETIGTLLDKFGHQNQVLQGSRTV